MTHLLQVFRQYFLTESYYYYAVNRLNADIVAAEITGDFADQYLWRLCRLQLGYTAGESIEHLEQLLQPAIKSFAKILPALAKMGEEREYLIIPEDASNGAYLVSSLCILLNQEALLDDFFEAVLDIPSLVFDCFLKMIWHDTDVDEDEPLPRGFAFRKNLKKAIEATNPQDVVKYLKAYLAAWYSNLGKVGNAMIDGHLEQEDAEKSNCYRYFGYWAFEAAAVAYLKDIDDTELHEFIYYPTDIVQYAREKYPLHFNQDGTVKMGLSCD